MMPTTILKFIVALGALIGLGACAEEPPSESTSPVQAIEAPESSAPAACDQECVAVLREALQWFIDETSYAPHRIVLDTARAGTSPQGGQRIREVPVSALAQLSDELGVTVGTRDPALVGDCPGPTSLLNYCALRGGVTLVELGPPRISGGGGEAAVMVTQYASAARYTDQELNTDREVWRPNGSEPLLEKAEDGRWRVTGIATQRLNGGVIPARAEPAG